MRMLLEVEFPIEPFNSMVRAGTIGETIGKVLAEIKPEAAYFSERDGRRGAIMVVDLQDPSGVPALAEPLFLAFNAAVKFRICMTADDLGRSGLDEIGRRYV
ncbi:MAG TPA: hypothetical protein VMU76_09720 [Acidimicrobiales bacterium]|nr:hypothetical protein [Acidimicrobiales bacterium]